MRIQTVNPAPPAFRQQLLDQIPRLRRYARALVFDPDRADDLVQSTLERGLTHWHQYDQRRDMGAWLLSIAHNAYMDQLRRDRRLTAVDPGDLQDLQDRAGGDAGTDVGLRMDLMAALARLSAEQRESLLLVCVEQLSYAEVAEVMQVPLGTVMSRVCRARAAMRQILEGRRAPPAPASPVLRRVV